MSTKDITTTSTEIQLAAREVWSSKAAPGLELACKQGIVWLTQSNAPHDYILHPAQRFLATRRGKAVVQVLTAATITVIWRHTSRMRSPLQIIGSVLDVLMTRMRLTLDKKLKKPPADLAQRSGSTDSLRCLVCACQDLNLEHDC